MVVVVELVVLLVDVELVDDEVVVVLEDVDVLDVAVVDVEPGRDVELELDVVDVGVCVVEVLDALVVVELEAVVEELVDDVLVVDDGMLNVVDVVARGIVVVVVLLVVVLVFCRVEVDVVGSSGLSPDPGSGLPSPPHAVSVTAAAPSGV